MSQKWNLQDIRPVGENRSKKKRRMPAESMSEPASSKASNMSDATDTSGHSPMPAQPPMSKAHIPSIVIEDGRKRSNRNLIFSIVAFVAILGTALFLSSTLGRTEITIYPEFRDPNISAEFTATPQAVAGGLRYEIMTLTETAETQVKATGKVEVEEQASGVIEIAKNTPGAERLRAQTRFRSADGLIYRIPESVIVPGAVTNDAGEVVPGTIRADVFADDIGAEYNLAAGATFDVPGFDEGGHTALFNAISATNPEPFTGGFAGLKFRIEETELATARQTLQLQLRNQLLDQIKDAKPAGTIALPGGVAFTFVELPAVEYDETLVTVQEQATLQIPLFRADEFGQFLAQETIATYEDGPVRVEDPTVLAFTYKNATTSSSNIANADSLTFTLTGKPRLIWEYDADKLAADLAGLPKTAIRNAIKAYPGIRGAKADITPFWQRTFPTEAEEIIVIEELKEDFDN